MTDKGYWTELIRPLFVGRRVIVTGGPVAGLVENARLVRSLGAQRPFILGSEGIGTGALRNGSEVGAAVDVMEVQGLGTTRRVLSTAKPDRNRW